MHRLLVAGLVGASALAGAAAAEDAAPEAQPQADAAAEAPAPDYDASTVLATVNGAEITLGHVIVLRDRLPEQYQNLPDEVLFEGLVDQLVDQALLAETESASPEDDPLEVRLHLENERRGTLAGRAVMARVAEAIAEEDVEAAYDEAFEGFEPQPEFNASHILVETEEEAERLKGELDGGADFAALAQEHSGDGSAQAGGSLGWFGLGQMVPEFEAAVREMEAGEVAGPIETQFGWHLVRLDDTRMSSPPELDAVREQIVEQVRQERLTGELETLREAAEIERPETGVPPAAIREATLFDD